MTIKRRAFLTVLGATPAAALLTRAEAQVQAQRLAPTTASPPPVPADAPQPPIAGATTEKAGAEPAISFFTATQFATLKAVAAVLQPPMNGFPGAEEAEAARFIDFYVSQTDAKPVGRAELKRWYRAGLDDLEGRAKAKYGKSFAALSAAEIDVIIRPMFVTQGSGRQSISVTRRLPFMNEVRNDVRNATINSPQWAEAMARANRRPVAALYWKRIDPTIVEWK